MQAARAQRLRGERSRERRVDAARDADYDLPEPVLLHVVAQPELEREPHLVQLGERRRDVAGRRLRQVHHEQCLLETRRPCHDAAVPVEHERVPVEDELVLAADGVAEHEPTIVVSCPGREHLLALHVLADVEG